MVSLLDANGEEQRVIDFFSGVPLAGFILFYFYFFTLHAIGWRSHHQKTEEQRFRACEKGIFCFSALTCRILTLLTTYYEMFV